MSKRPNCDILDLIREAVLKANAIRPFSSFTQAIYRAALKIFILYCKNCCDVRSIILKQTPSSINWVPGISDLDVFLVLGDKLPASGIFEKVCLFWRVHLFCRRFLPVFDRELMLIQEAYLSNWRRYVVTASNLKGRNVAIWGEDLFKGQEFGLRGFQDTDLLGYVFMFLRLFNRISQDKSLTLYKKRLIFSRITYKAVRSLNPSRNDLADKSGFILRLRRNSRDQMLLLFLRQLEEKAKHSIRQRVIARNPGVDDYNVINDGGSVPGGLEARSVQIKGSFFNSPELKAGLLAAWIPPLKLGSLMVVLKGDMDDVESASCMRLVRQVLLRLSVFPEFLFPESARYFLLCEDPLHLLRLPLEGKVIFDQGIIPKKILPEGVFLLRNFLDSSAKLLSLTQEEWVFNPKHPWYRDLTDMSFVLERLTALRVFLEEDKVYLFSAGIKDRAQSLYPGFSREINEFKKAHPRVFNRKEALARYIVLSKLVREINRYLSENQTAIDRKMADRMFIRE